MKTFKISIYAFLMIGSLNGFSQEIKTVADPKNKDSNIVAVFIPVGANVLFSSPIDDESDGAKFLLEDGVPISMSQFNDSVKTSKYLYSMKPIGTERNYKLQRKQQTIYNFFNKIPPLNELEDFKGKQVILNAINSKTTYINFWGLSCKPCIDELETIEKLASKYPYVNFLAISYDDDPAVKTFLSKHKTSIRHIKNGVEAGKIFQVDFYPMHIVIDKNNLISTILPGLLSETTLKTLEEALAK